MTRWLRLAGLLVLLMLPLSFAAQAGANAGEWSDSTYVTVAAEKEWTRSPNVALALCGYNNHSALPPNLIYLDQCAVANAPEELTSFVPYMDGNQLSAWGLEFSKGWQLAAGDGLKTVYALFTARVVGTPVDEPSSPVVSDQIMLDTHGPRVAAPKRASVQKGKLAKLRYRVTDNLSPTTKVTVRVCTSSGKVVKTLRPGNRRADKLWTASFRCKLAPDTYRFLVYATDLAGNKQRKIGANRLTVTAPPAPKPVVPVAKVGITQTGECYHRLTCYWWLKDPDGNSVVSLSYAKSMGFRPCKVCDPPQ